MRIGIDVDGVLADFNEAYIRLTTQLTGRDLFPSRPFDITTWNYPESYGYTAEEVSRVWAAIKADPFFWQGLAPYDTAEDAMRAIHLRWRANDDIYFITSRPGIDAKKQTENWLRMYWPLYTVPPLTVLISSEKGLCAQALNLDVYIDDRVENVTDVHFRTEASTRAHLLDQPWNRHLDWPHRVTKLEHMFEP